MTHRTRPPSRTTRPHTPPQAFSYLTSHGSLDIEHMKTFEGLMKRLDRDEDREAVVHTARVVYRLYGDMFSALVPTTH